MTSGETFSESFSERPKVSPLTAIERIIQRDVNNRGLAKDPTRNLITSCRGDFAEACQTLARSPIRNAIIVTGFFIPSARAAETDGPLGAVLLARALDAMGWSVVIAAEERAFNAIQSAIRTAVARDIRIVRFEDHEGESLETLAGEWASHWIMIETPGPSHNPDSLAGQFRGLDQAPIQRFHEAVPSEHRDQFHNMKGEIITDSAFPVHLLMENWSDVAGPEEMSIGIGDGGNEIGMGNIPWEVIADNIPNGALIACQVPTSYNIVCGISNWGAYGLAAGVWHLSQVPFDEKLWNPDAERALWEKVIHETVLVDGVTGQRTLTVDGLGWDEFIGPFREIAAILKEHCRQ